MFMLVTFNSSFHFHVIGKKRRKFKRIFGKVSIMILAHGLILLGSARLFLPSKRSFAPTSLAHEMKLMKKQIIGSFVAIKEIEQ